MFPLLIKNNLRTGRGSKRPQVRFTGSFEKECNFSVRLSSFSTRYFSVRNWSIRNWGYRSQNFKKVECHITPILRNLSAANSRNSIFGVHEIHDLCIDASPKLRKVIYWGFPFDNFQYSRSVCLTMMIRNQVWTKFKVNICFTPMRVKKLLRNF